MRVQRHPTTRAQAEEVLCLQKVIVLLRSAASPVGRYTSTQISLPLSSNDKPSCPSTSTSPFEGVWAS